MVSEPVIIKRLRDGVELPKYATPCSAGFDLAAAENVVVLPGEIVLVPTGLIIATPPGHMLMLASRSSTPKRHNLMMPHGIGIVDLDYCGDEDEIKIQVINFGGKTIVVGKGTCIAQGIFVPITRGRFIEESTMGQSRGGFGSTDRKEV